MEAKPRTFYANIDKKKGGGRKGILDCMLIFKDTHFKILKYLVDKESIQTYLNLNIGFY